MDDTVRIRDFRPDDRDYEGIAALNAAADDAEFLDFEVTTAAELRELQQSFDPARYTMRWFVAEEAGRIVGYAFYCHMPWAFDPDAYWASIRCAPDRRGRGLGGRLYAHMLDVLNQIGAKSLRMEAREQDAVAAEALARRGFVEEVRSLEFVLDVRRAELSAFSGYAERSAAKGIAIVPLLEVKERDADWLPKLLALHNAVELAIPLPDELQPVLSPDGLVDYLFNAPEALPEGCFVAIAGDRYVGECVLYRRPNDKAMIDHMVTGVDEAFRGRGIAAALKLRSIEFAQQNGYERISTWVESNNPSMLAINEKVGFVHAGGIIVLEKRLAP